MTVVLSARARTGAMHRRPGEKQSPPGPFTEGLDATNLNVVKALP